MSTAIVSLSDRNFLIPTAGTALAARMHVSDPSVAIFVYVTDATDVELSNVRIAAAERGIIIKSAPIAEIGKISPKDFKKRHVPTATLARLWISDFLDPMYRTFLYIDGDVDIASSLDPLLALSIPKLGFLAAPDTPMLRARERGINAINMRAYLRGIGVKDPYTYFNAGVLLVDRAGWKDLADEAWHYFSRHPDRCQYHDQSALNAVAQDRRGWLSLRWNYQSEFMATVDPRKSGVEPAIWHFTGFPKPWQAPVFPWKSGFGSSYRLGMHLLKDTGCRCDLPKNVSVAEGVKEREKLRFRLQWIYPWRRLSRAHKIRKALNRT